MIYRDVLLRTNHCISLMLLVGILEDEEQKMVRKTLMKNSGKIKGKHYTVLIKACFISVISKIKIIIINDII